MSDGHEQHDVIVIGGGQAGLSVGYHLGRKGIRATILEAHDRVGDPWRRRWDSLRLFTPACFDGLDGMPWPGPSFYFPTKDEMADYLEAYARRFDLDVRTGTRVDGLTRSGERFVVTAGERRFEADQVVVAMADYQRPRVPALAAELAPHIVQIHSMEYRNPDQLGPGDALVVGAGNSGAEIAREIADGRTVWFSGRDVGQIPFRIGGRVSRLGLGRLMLRGVFHRLLTRRTPLGRAARRKVLHKGGPLIRVKWADLQRAGVRRVPRTTGVRDGKPLVEDGRVLDVGTVVWCTGFRPGFDWIDLPVFDERGDPAQVSGFVESEPGLYFTGLHFLHSLSSAMIHGTGRDAARLSEAIALRAA